MFDHGKMKFRFIISDSLKEKMQKFSKIHIYSTRQSVKEKWVIWIKENRELIVKEKQNLEKYGYSGSNDDFINKLFFSVKYYYMKKHQKPDDQYDSTISKDDDENTQIKIIKCVDNHIQCILHYIQRPSECYLDFININKENIYSEFLRIISEYDKSIKIRLVFEKIKKCYENRYYIYRRRACARSA